jgi:hypothetical protein
MMDVTLFRTVVNRESSKVQSLQRQRPKEEDQLAGETVHPIELVREGEVRHPSLP